MVVVMFIKNGKTWTEPLQKMQVDGVNISEPQENKNCQFDNAKLSLIYDYTQYSGALTEIPEDFLPDSFKKANMETISIFRCEKCQKNFISWFNGNDIEEFHEVKLLPDGDYSRDSEAGTSQPVIPKNEQIYGVHQHRDSECDCGGECGNHECDNNKMNSKNKFDRPNFYG